MSWRCSVPPATDFATAGEMSSRVKAVPAVRVSSATLLPSVVATLDALACQVAQLTSPEPNTGFCSRLPAGTDCDRAGTPPDDGGGAGAGAGSVVGGGAGDGSGAGAGVEVEDGAGRES